MTTPTPDQRTQILRLITRLQRALAEFSVTTEANPSARELDAARWLYEKLADYKGMLYERPLSRSIEFIVYPSSSTRSPGWYYKFQSEWIGPYSSHSEAREARDQDLPKTLVAFTLKKLLTPEFTNP